MEGYPTVWLLFGCNVSVYVKLDDFPSHFADSTEQAFQISVNGGLGTGLVRFDLIDDLEHTKFRSSVKTQEVS